MNKKFYIGDGVYVEFDGYGVWLYANDPENPSDKIYLEPSVLETLNQIYNSFIQKNEAKNDINRI